MERKDFSDAAAFVTCLKGNQDDASEVKQSDAWKCFNAGDTYHALQSLIEAAWFAGAASGIKTIQHTKGN